jgi:signal transduction histidine kinase/ActR/RegA family two-component response regulator
MSAEKNKNTLKVAEALSPKQELEQYRMLFKALPDIIYKINSEGYFVYVSDAIAELGYKPEELIGKHFSEIIHPEDINSISREAVLPLYKGKNTGDAASPKLFDERRCGIRGTKRLVIRFVPKYIKENVQPIIEGEENQFYGEVHSYGDYFDKLLKQIQPSADEAANGVIYGEVSSSGDYGKREKNTPEKFSGSVGIIRNITDKVILYKQKASLEEQLHHSMKIEAVGQMTMGIVHDLNNVMNTCLCSAELIKEKISIAPCVADKQTQEMVMTMINEVMSGTNLIRALLDFARKTRSKSATINGHALISDVMHLLEYTLESNITITGELHAENPYIIGDTGQLQNALVNIAINARDAMEKGGSIVFLTENILVKQSLSLPARQKSIQGEYFVISITDTGCGIDAKVHDRLFEPFFTTKPPGKGTGLGLANVLRVMKNHKGFIDVISAAGRGTTFRLYLPVTIYDTVSSLDTVDSRSDVLPVYIKSRIMVIDNDASICEILKLTLQNVGCDVTVHTNPVNAIEAFRKHASDFDIVLIDMLMPEFNGFECFRRLRKINHSLKAVLISGLNELINEKLIFDMGFAGSVAKPFNIRTLIQTIEKISKASASGNNTLK